MSDEIKATLDNSGYYLLTSNRNELIRKNNKCLHFRILYDNITCTFFYRCIRYSCSLWLLDDKKGIFEFCKKCDGLGTLKLTRWL